MVVLFFLSFYLLIPFLRMRIQKVTIPTLETILTLNLFLLLFFNDLLADFFEYFLPNLQYMINKFRSIGVTHTHK